MMQLSVGEFAELCKESSDSDTPTPLEFAFGMVTDAGYAGAQTELLTFRDDDDTNQFREGWEAGLECDLDLSSMPGNHERPLDTKAWLVGFIAGQYALANSYKTPFCVFANHEHGDAGY